MKSFFKDKLAGYFDAIIGNAIYDFLKFIFIYFICTFSTTIISNILFDIFNFTYLQKYKKHLIIIIILIVSYLVIDIYTRNFKHRPNYPAIDTNFEIEKKISSFTYGRDLSHYETHLFIKSNINGLRKIPGKYTWSGSEAAIIKCATTHCNIIPLTRKDSFIEYEVELGKSYKKGKRTECKIVGDMPDSMHTFVPFFSIQITEITKELIINICIPTEYNVNEVITEEIAIVRNSNENSEVVKLDSEGKYTWTIKNPKLFYKYSVRWDLN